MKIILASKSPRRIQLLKETGFDFEVMPSDYEELFHENLPPELLVMKHAEGKADYINEKLKMKNGKSKTLNTIYKIQNTFILGIDTVGYCMGKILEKPVDRAHAQEMIKMLASEPHVVFSGMCVIDLKSNKKIVQYEKTEITFGEMKDSDIEWYLDQNEWQDKAAAYAIQGKGALFVKEIKGDFFNIVGLPLHRLNQMLKSF